MSKKIVRITENDLHRIIAESVNKILKEGKYDVEDGYFDNYACLYDQALKNARDEEEFDKMMSDREKNTKTRGNISMYYHPQRTPKWDKRGGSIPSFSYAHSPELFDTFVKKTQYP